MKETINSDTAESSIMQTIGIAVSILTGVSLITFAGMLLNGGDDIVDTNTVVSETIITEASLTRELGSANQFIEASDARATVFTNNAQCVSFGIEVAEDARTQLVRTYDGVDCGMSEETSKRSTMLWDISEDSLFQYTNVAGLRIIDGAPVGDCPQARTVSECASTIPKIVKFVSTVSSPLTDMRTPVSVVTEAVELELLESPTGSSDIESPVAIPGDMQPVTD